MKTDKMKTDNLLLHRIRTAYLIGLPFLLAASFFCNYYLSSTHWASAFFTLSLTANIGYFTNFIAIKMLFRPYKKSVLGRHGLIPKNQPKLASALSNTLNHHFLQNDHWNEYLDKAQISERLAAQISLFITNWLSDKRNHLALLEFSKTFIHSNQNSINLIAKEMTLSLFQTWHKDSHNSAILTDIFSWIDEQFEKNPRKMEVMIEPLVTTIAENIPLIAEKLMETLDQHIEKQDTIKRQIAKAAKWSANIEHNDIKNYLFRMVASPTFRATLFEGLQSLIKQYRERELISNLDLNNAIDALFNSILEKQNFNVADTLLKKLESPEAISLLSKLLARLATPISHWVKLQINNPEVKQYINTNIIELIESIDLQEVIEDKARHFSPKEMEYIFKNMIADQLVFIELLGAFLGALSGIALINLNIFAGISGLTLSYFLLDVYLTNKREQNKNSSEKQSQTFHSVITVNLKKRS